MFQDGSFETFWCRCRRKAVPCSAALARHQRMRSQNAQRRTMQENAVSEKPRFGTVISAARRSETRASTVFGSAFNCIGSERRIRRVCPDLEPGDPWGPPGRNTVGALIRRKRRIQVLVIQWLQAHITLFSKYFASFPHGTCSLSDSRRYLALEEMYLPICAPIPGNATLRARTERGAAQVLDGTVTLRCAPFQETYTCRAAGHASRYYTAQHGAVLLDMSSSFFIRHYLKNPLSFRFHHLLICLNSEGNFSQPGFWRVRAAHAQACGSHEPRWGRRSREAPAHAKKPRRRETCNCGRPELSARCVRATRGARVGRRGPADAHR